MLTYKRKLRLNNAQEQRIRSWIGACRLVYNMGLEIRISAYKNKQANVSKYDLMKQLTDIKDIDWIADVPSQSLQDSIDRLDRSYQTFFRTSAIGGGFPKFKSKKEYKSILFKYAKLRGINEIAIPKIGCIKFFKDKSPILGNIKTAQIIIEPTGFFIYIVCDKVSKCISNPDDSQVIGIDMGLSYFATDSNGNHIVNPKHFKKHERRLRIENRSFSRKKKGSRRWHKQAKRLAVLYSKIADVRRDFLHKESTKIANAYHTVYLEDLNIKGMVKSKNISKHILDCGWGIFRKMLEYKTNVIAINPRYTSQTCNECGGIDSKNRVSQSDFVCIQCGHISNADINAARNILSKGIALNRQREALACA